MTDRIDERLQVVSRSGASWTGNVEKNDIVGDILEKEPSVTKKELTILEGAMARVEDAIALLEDAQETLVHADPKFEFPVGIIFSAQTSLRVVVELAKDAAGSETGKKSVRGKAGQKKKGGKKGK
jgi:hypothetical protein